MTSSFFKPFRRFGARLLLPLLLAGCAAEQHHRDGLTAMEASNYNKGITELAQASELKPKDVEYRNDWLRARETSTVKLLAVASAALADGKNGEAEKAYRIILSYERENARALAGLESLASAGRAASDVAQARQAFKQGDITLATDLANRALKSVPAQADARALLRDIEASQMRETPSVPTLGAVYKKPINLEFRDASIKMVFDALSRTTGINFIFDRDVKADQRTTVFLKQTTLDDAIDVILSTGQLEKKILNASSVLIYPSTPAKLREYQDLMVRAFYLANVDAKQAATMLKTVLKLKDVYVDEKYNMLMLRESPESIALAERLIALQDLEEPEVMLEVEVLEINRNRLLNLGIQWNGQFTLSPLAVTTSGSDSSGSSTATGTSTMKLSDLKSINSAQIGITPPSATINLQKTDGDANLLANPRIRVRDREKAKFLIGDKVPVVTTTTTSTFVTENIQYLDVGLKLEVEPDIHLHDEIGLKVALEVSSLVSSVKTNNGSQAYQIGTRNVNTALRLKDGETQIMAGLINDEDRSAANRIPLLGDLPVLGRLFGSQNDNRQKTEIVLSITPHLIRNIQRKNPAAESFWSGTEATLRNKPLQLRPFDGGAAPASGGASGGAPRAAPAAGGAGDSGTPPMSPASAPNAPKLSWEGPAEIKAGELVTLYLNMDSPELLRASSLQLAFNPAELEIVSVEPGDYFSRTGKGTFSQNIDAAGGRVSVGASVSEGGGVKGRGRVLAMGVKGRAPVNGVNNYNLGLIAMTPIGSQQAVGRPGLPVLHALTVAP